MHIQATLDQVLTPHGNWQSLSPGWVITIWLIHILSEYTYCMDRVQTWVAKRCRALRALTGQPSGNWMLPMTGWCFVCRCCAKWRRGMRLKPG